VFIIFVEQSWYSNVDYGLTIILNIIIDYYVSIVTVILYCSIYLRSCTLYRIILLNIPKELYPLSYYTAVYETMKSWLDVSIHFLLNNF